VRQSEWSYTTSGVVDATPQSVMNWWFHPDRRTDLQKRIEALGTSDVSVTESTTDGLRVRIAHWKGKRGSDHHHHAETTLGIDGLAALDGDRFVAPVSDVVSLLTPSGLKMTRTCSGRIEFVPLTDGAIEVSMVHSHVLVGGGWFQRRSHHRSEQANTERMFRESIARCQAAVGRSAS
jgi:hypothetical protein